MNGLDFFSMEDSILKIIDSNFDIILNLWKEAQLRGYGVGAHKLLAITEQYEIKIEKTEILLAGREEMRERGICYENPKSVICR